MREMRARYLFLVAVFGLLVCSAPPARADVTLQVLSPRGEIPPPPGTPGLSPRVVDLAGKRIGLIANFKAGAELFLTKLEELIKQKYPTAKIVRLRMGKNYVELAEQIDTFIHSTGD
jgi:hypothetical protein